MINEVPDMYLRELRTELKNTCGVEVSLATVWRALRRGGYTMKKVSMSNNLGSECSA